MIIQKKVQERLSQFPFSNIFTSYTEADNIKEYLEPTKDECISALHDVMGRVVGSAFSFCVDIVHPNSEDYTAIVSWVIYGKVYLESISFSVILDFDDNIKIEVKNNFV